MHYYQGKQRERPAARLTLVAGIPDSVPVANFAGAGAGVSIQVMSLASSGSFLVALMVN
jgi:hypothetical protein